jgi:hypothetical protein
MISFELPSLPSLKHIGDGKSFKHLQYIKTQYTIQTKGSDKNGPNLHHAMPEKQLHRLRRLPQNRMQPKTLLLHGTPTNSRINTKNNAFKTGTWGWCFFLKPITYYFFCCNVERALKLPDQVFCFPSFELFRRGILFFIVNETS